MGEQMDANLERGREARPNISFVCGKCGSNHSNAMTANHCPCEPVKAGALDVQIAGAHYKKRPIQPVEYIHANGLGFLEGCVVKRITRWRDKPAANPFEDLEKIKHEIDLLIALETARSNEQNTSVSFKGGE